MYARRLSSMEDLGINENTNGKKLSSSLIVELDGATFGADPSTNRVPLVFPRPPEEDIDIPHFPPLTGSFPLRIAKRGSMSEIGQDGKAQRTSGMQADRGAVFRTSGKLPYTSFSGQKQPKGKQVAYVLRTHKYEYQYSH